MPSTAPKYLVGTRCRSEVWDLYEGKIIHTPNNEDDFYKVRYNDGDEEELDLAEIHKCRNNFLDSKKKPSEAKKKKYKMGTKVANFFPNGDSVDGQIISVMKNSYRVQYDDDTTETIDKVKMKEEVEAYKKAYPDYVLPDAKTPSTSVRGKRKAADSSNQKKAKAKAESNKGTTVAAASSKPMAQDEDDSKSSQMPKTSASTRMSPRRAKASTSKGLSPKKVKAATTSSNKSPQKAKATPNHEKTSSTTQEIQKVFTANIEGKDLFDDEKSEHVDSNAKEQSISNADEGVSKASTEEKKSENKAGEEEEQAETNTKDQHITKGPQHMDAEEAQTSDLQISNEPKKKGRRSKRDKIQSISSGTGESVKTNGVERSVESVSDGSEKASVKKIDQHKKGKELSAGGDDTVGDPIANSKSDQTPRSQDIAASRKESEPTSKESEKEPSNVSQTANAKMTSSTSSSRRNDADSESVSEKSIPNSSKSSSSRVPKKSVKSTKRKLLSSPAPQDSIGEPLNRKKGEKSDGTISKKRPRPNSPLETVENSSKLQVESPGKKETVESLFALKSGKFLNHESGNKGEKALTSNRTPVSEGNGNSKEEKNEDLVDEKDRLFRAQEREKALEFKAKNKMGNEANPILIEDNGVSDDEIEVIANPNIEKLSIAKIDAQSKKPKEGERTKKKSKKTKDLPPSTPPKLKNKISSEEAIKSAEKALKITAPWLSDSETMKTTEKLSPKPRNGNSPLKKRKPSSNLSQEFLQAANSRDDQNHNKKKSPPKKDAVSTSNASQASIQASNSKDKHSRNKKKSPPKKDASLTSNASQVSLQAANSKDKHSRNKKKSPPKKDASLTSNASQASIQAANSKDKHSRNKKKSPPKKDASLTSTASQVSLQAANSKDKHSHNKKKSPPKKDAVSTSNASQALLQSKEKASAEKTTLNSASEEQVKKNKSTSYHSKEGLTNTNRLPFVRSPQGIPGKELKHCKKRRMPEALEQRIPRKKQYRKLPTAKNRDVSNSPEMSRKSENCKETNVVAIGEKAGQKKVVSSASSSSDNMSISSSEEKSSETNAGKCEGKVACIAPNESKEKGSKTVNISSKECNGLQKSVSMESQKGEETSMNTEGSVKSSKRKKGIDGFNQHDFKALQSVKATTKSIDKGIHSRPQIAQCLSQAEKVSKAAIEAENDASKSSPKGTVGLKDRNPKPVQEFLQTQLDTVTNSTCPEKEDRSSASKNDKRKVHEIRPVGSIREGPSSPRVEDRDPLPSANILAQRFGKTSSVENTSSKSTPSSSSEKLSGSLVDAGKKADDIALSTSISTSYPPTLMDPVANEKVGKQPSSQESISKASSTTANASSQNKVASFKQPKGRPRKGKTWDSVNGVWVPLVARTPDQTSKGTGSPKKCSNVPSKDAGTTKKSSNLPNKEPRKFPKPQGRPRLNCTWDSSNGIWVPNNDDQIMSHKQKSRIQLRNSLEIKVTLNGEYVNSVPKMKYYGSWPDAKSSGSIRKASEDSTSGGFKRPRGRARLGKSWDSRLGKWVADGSKKPTPPSATSPFKEKMDYLSTMDSDSNNRGRTTRSEYNFELNLARALRDSRNLELKKLYEESEKLKTSNEDSASSNLKRGEENNSSDNLKRGEEKKCPGNLKRGEENHSKGDNVNSSAITEEELDEIINTKGGTDHALNDLLNQASSSPTKKTNMFGDTSLDGMGESISFANSNHGITTPTIDQLLLTASPLLNNHRMSLPFSIEELNRDMERNHDLHHPSTRNSSSSEINQRSSSNVAQQDIPQSGDQNMDTEGLTSPVIRLLGEIQTPSPYKNREAEARIAVANRLVHLRHSPILTSREVSPQNNPTTDKNDDARISTFDKTLFPGSNIQPPPRPSSAPPVLIPPRPSSAPPMIGTTRPSFTTATSNHGRTISTTAENKNLLQRYSLGAPQQKFATRENLPRVDRGKRADSAVQQQQQSPVDRPRAEPAVRPQAAPINPPQPPVAEVQIPAHHAERHGNQENPAQESVDELEEVPIDDEEEEQAPAMQEPQAAPVEERNNETGEAQAQERNNEAEGAQESDNLSYVAGRARFYTEDDSSIENFVFESGWGSENDSDDSTDPGVVEPHEYARLRMLEQQERERQRQLREQHQQQQRQNQRNQQNNL